ncbi:MAG: hypothetical protein WC325_07025 [Candidatus Bathyarchaeia archaeon]|jgi:hypothetical protein
MDTGKKLMEAEYFLEILLQTDFNKRDEFHYNLSAFLSAWRSIFDIMLYDFAEIFKIGLSRESKIYDESFALAAHNTQNTQALGFIKWWRKKVNNLSKNRLWDMRPEIVHRGYPEMRTKAYANFSVIVASDNPNLDETQTSKFTVTDSEILKMCNEGLDSMKDIVNEAERTFGYTLT